MPLSCEKIRPKKLSVLTQHEAVFLFLNRSQKSHNFLLLFIWPYGPFSTTSLVYYHNPDKADVETSIPPPPPRDLRTTDMRLLERIQLQPFSARMVCFEFVRKWPRHPDVKLWPWLLLKLWEESRPDLTLTTSASCAPTGQGQAGH